LQVMRPPWRVGGLPDWLGAGSTRSTRKEVRGIWTAK
jgi:hypothetical protein